MSLRAARNKLDMLAYLRGVSRGIAKYYANQKTVVLAGTTYKVRDLVGQIDQQVALLAAAGAARASWLRAVGVQRAHANELRPLLRHLEMLTGAVYGERSLEFREFGYTPRKVGRPSSETKALAVVKRQQTRKARGTMGRRQRLRVKAAPPGDTSN